MFGLSVIRGVGLQNTWSFLSKERDKGDFCYVNEVTFGKSLGMGLVARRTNQEIRGMEISVPSPRHLGRRRARNAVQSPEANGLTHHTFVVELHRNPKGGSRELLGWTCRDGGDSERRVAAPQPSPHTLHLFREAVPQL